MHYYCTASAHNTVEAAIKSFTATKKKKRKHTHTCISFLVDLKSEVYFFIFSIHIRMGGGNGGGGSGGPKWRYSVFTATKEKSTSITRWIADTIEVNWHTTCTLRRGNVVSLSFILPHPPEDKKKKTENTYTAVETMNRSNRKSQGSLCLVGISRENTRLHAVSPPQAISEEKAGEVARQRSI